MYSQESSDELDNSSEDNGHLQNDDLIDNVNEPLYPGAPLKVAESTLSIFSITCSFKAPGVLLANIRTLIELHCIQPNNCVKSLYKFKQFFSKIESPLIRHYYCSLCLSKLDKYFCNNCKQNENISYFLEIPIISQIIKMFKRSEFRDNLNCRFTRFKKKFKFMKIFTMAMCSNHYQKIIQRM